jgi:hypothetical protein
MLKGISSVISPELIKVMFETPVTKLDIVAIFPPVAGETSPNSGIRVRRILG